MGDDRFAEKILAAVIDGFAIPPSLPYTTQHHLSPPSKFHIGVVGRIQGVKELGLDKQWRIGFGKEHSLHAHDTKALGWISAGALLHILVIARFREHLIRCQGFS